jgi:16S rRNA (adenine1518-N6/adenine1519-N6)-dimethyltransferase
MYRLKKSLGQHFLKDENVSRNIVSALQQCTFRQLLEIGPGGGALTKYLLELPGIDFKAVELDDEKVSYLEQALPAIKGKIIHKSFLEIDKPFPGKFAVIGNFPYNISTEILFKIIEWKDDVECVVGMFQREVAQRLASREGNKIYGVTSVLTQAFFKVDYLFEVSEQCFQPPPKVKSAVIKLSPRAAALSISNEKDFFLLVKSAFNQRRKTLRNAARNLFDAETLNDEIFDRRAEQLKVEEFAALSFKMKSDN